MFETLNTHGPGGSWLYPLTPLPSSVSMNRPEANRDQLKLKVKIKQKQRVKQGLF
jgi:hypothetical protein